MKRINEIITAQLPNCPEKNHRDVLPNISINPTIMIITPFKTSRKPKLFTTQNQLSELKYKISAENIGFPTWSLKKQIFRNFDV